MYIYIYTHIYTYIHIHTYIYIYIHICVSLICYPIAGLAADEVHDRVAEDDHHGEGEARDEARLIAPVEIRREDHKVGVGEVEADGPHLRKTVIYGHTRVCRVFRGIWGCQLGVSTGI